MSSNITSLVSLRKAVIRNSVINIVDNEDTTISVYLNDRHVTTGNDGDFYPGCHGGFFYDLEAQYGSWLSLDGFVLVLEAAAIDHGAKHVLITRNK